MDHFPDIRHARRLSRIARFANHPVGRVVTLILVAVVVVVLWIPSAMIETIWRLVENRKRS